MSPLAERLNNVQWGEFRVGDLFSIENTLSFNIDKLVPGNEFDYVTRTSQNQGILQKTGYINSKNINSAGSWSLGLLQMDFFYRENPWYAGQYVRKVIAKFNINLFIVKFLTVILNKLKPILLSVLVRDVDEIFLNSEIFLPINHKGDIDFNFMESFISDIEAEHIKVLDAYLKVTGLEDYELTEQEYNLLEEYDKIEWGEFRVGDLFEIGTGSLIPNSELISGNIPRVSARSDNNGIIGYFKTENILKARHFENFISVNFFGSYGGIFYHPYNASVEMKVHTLKIPNIEFTASSGLFICSALKKALNGFNYGQQLSSSKLKELNFMIKLPISNGQIDFDFMESFISDIEAEHIKVLDAYLKVTGLEGYK